VTTERAIRLWHAAAKAAGRFRPRRRYVKPWPAVATEPGISVVIPSRNGRELLAAQMAGIARDLQGFDSEIVVVDNGSGDGTAGWLASEWPQVRVEESAAPLSFARAVNRGIALARYGHVCLLNNDMVIEPGFFEALLRAFARVPDLFCATAQIFFPDGVRREETGKAVYRQPEPEDFPIRCDEPLAGEDLTWVLYGSGGCSLYDAAKLRALGAIDEAFDPVYVEDLDIGYRAWQRGWASVYVAGARLEHRHRATSSRYYSEGQLEAILERNYLKFVARAVAAPAVFDRLWDQALRRLALRAPRSAAARGALRAAWRTALEGGAPDGAGYPDELILALGAGDVAVIPGAAPVARRRALFAASKAGAVQPGSVLLEYADRLDAPEQALLATSAEIVLVRRAGGPAAFRAALEQSVRKWRPETVVLRGAEMPQFLDERYNPYLRGAGSINWICPDSPYQVSL